MKRLIRILVLALAMLMALAAPASAHIIEITPPGTDGPVETHLGEAWEEFKQEADEFGMGHVGWVGGMHSFAAHGGGLIHACVALDGNEVVFIGAPWNEANHCKHFGQ